MPKGKKGKGKGKGAKAFQIIAPPVAAVRYGKKSVYPCASPWETKQFSYRHYDGIDDLLDNPLYKTSQKFNEMVLYLRVMLTHANDGFETKFIPSEMEMRFTTTLINYMKVAARIEDKERQEKELDSLYDWFIKSIVVIKKKEVKTEEELKHEEDKKKAIKGEGRGGRHVVLKVLGENKCDPLKNVLEEEDEKKKGNKLRVTQFKIMCNVVCLKMYTAL
jgi:hypothetical protein